MRQRPWLQGMDAACQNQLLCVGQWRVHCFFFCFFFSHLAPLPPLFFPLTLCIASLHLTHHLSHAGWLKTSTAGRKLVVGAGLISGNVTANGAKKGRCVLESIPRGTALVCQSRDITVQTKA